MRGIGLQQRGKHPKVIRLETLVDHCRPSTGTGYIFGACDFVTPDTARNFLLSTGARIA